ncbi:MAG: thiol-disulfide oxidoreductase DCC family protein [Pararhodobacter sp.]
MALYILYNGACPICSREIAHYRRLADRRGVPVHFQDLNRIDLSSWQLTPDQARRRLHALDGGTRLHGLAAFRALWAHLPGWRWLALVSGLPVINPLIGFLYDRIAAPLLYRLSRARGGA